MLLLQIGPPIYAELIKPPNILIDFFTPDKIKYG